VVKSARWKRSPLISGRHCSVQWVFYSARLVRAYDFGPMRFGRMVFGGMILGVLFWAYNFGRMILGVWFWAYDFGHMILGVWYYTMIRGLWF